MQLLPWSLILAALWGPVIFVLGAQWTIHPQYHYGWFVPVLCLFLAWERSHSAPAPTPATRRGLAIAVIVVSGVIFGFARLLQESNPVWRAPGWGMTVSAATMTLAAINLLRGGKCALHYAFPVLFFLLAVPWPMFFELAAVRHLTSLNTAGVVEILSFLGVPALQHGNVIEVNTGVVGVEEACSGIRSLQATLMLSIFFGEFYPVSIARRLLLVCCGVAAAFFFNMGRTCFLTFMAARHGTDSVQQWHDTAGMSVLAFCAVSIWLLALLLHRFKKSPPPDKIVSEKLSAGAKGEFAEPATDIFSLSCDGGAGEGRGEGGLISETDAAGGHPKPLLSPTLSSISWKRGSFGFDPSALWKPWPVAIALLLWIGGVEAANRFWFGSQESRARDFDWSVRWSEEMPGYRAREMSKMAFDQLRYDSGKAGGWTDEQGRDWQVIYLQWLPARTFYGRARTAMAVGHNPEICLSGAGWQMESQLPPVTIQPRPGLPLEFQRYLFRADQGLWHVFFAVIEDSPEVHLVAVADTTRLNKIRDALAGSRVFGQRIIEVAIRSSDSPEEALQIFQRQLSQWVQSSSPADAAR